MRMCEMESPLKETHTVGYVETANPDFGPEKGKFTANPNPVSILVQVIVSVSLFELVLCGKDS